VERPAQRRQQCAANAPRFRTAQDIASRKFDEQVSPDKWDQQPDRRDDNP
jgi:hypothetical protein